jgi:hypothetical protein
MMAELQSPAAAGVTETSRAEAAEGYVDVVLEGGPATFPAAERTRRGHVDEDRIKVPFYGGHEHFERVDGRQRPVVYRWVTRTRLAE